jgi:hypothetical protein
MILKEFGITRRMEECIVYAEQEVLPAAFNVIAPLE